MKKQKKQPKQPQHITEFKQLLEEHNPMMILPLGLQSLVIARIIGEGFLYDSSQDKAKGLFFLDFGWQVSMSGSQAEHFIDGELSKPKDDLKNRHGRKVGYNQYWILGDAYIFDIARQRELIQFHDYDNEGHIEISSFIGEAMRNQELVERFKDDKYLNRKGAQKIANQFFGY